MVKVSVVVPCYNVAPWLVRCLDSLMNQTLHDIEIICIDDRSTDGTFDILDEYSRRDKRIKFIMFPQNQGVAVARNAGMDAATGEYIGFVDPDDYVDLDFYEKLYDAAQKNNADIVRGNVRTTVAADGSVRDETNLLQAIDADFHCFIGGFWAAIYRREFLSKNDIKFPAGVITAQDSVFLANVILATTGVSVCADTYYNYFYQRPGSLDSKILNHKKAVSKYRAVSMIFDAINAANISDEDRVIMVREHFIIPIAYNLNYKEFEDDADRKQMFDLLIRGIKNYDGKSLVSKYFDKEATRHILKNNYVAWREYIGLTIVRFYLFDIIPTLIIRRGSDATHVRLFKIIPLITVRHHRKVFLFGIIPVCKWRIHRPLQ